MLNHTVRVAGRLQRKDLQDVCLSTPYLNERVSSSVHWDFKLNIGGRDLFESDPIEERKLCSRFDFQNRGTSRWNGSP